MLPNRLTIVALTIIHVPPLRHGSMLPKPTPKDVAQGTYHPCEPESNFGHVQYKNNSYYAGQQSSSNFEVLECKNTKNSWRWWDYGQ